MSESFLTDPVILDAIIVIVGALGTIGTYLKDRQARKAEVTTQEVAKFYDQTNAAPVSNEVVAKLDPRTYTVSDATVKKLLDGRSREDQVRIREQIEKAQIEKKVVYVIDFLEGWYRIEYGALVDWEIYTKMESEKRPLFYVMDDGNQTSVSSYRGVVYLRKIANAKAGSPFYYYEETSGVALSEREVETIRKQAQVVIKT